MVWIKNFAKARAPAGLCLVAAIGMSGGFSPASALGPVVGTSAGTVGDAAAVPVGADGDVDTGVGVDDTVEGGAEEPAGVEGGAAGELVQAALNSASSTPIAAFRRTVK